MHPLPSQTSKIPRQRRHTRQHCSVFSYIPRSPPCKLGSKYSYSGKRRTTSWNHPHTYILPRLRLLRRVPLSPPCLPSSASMATSPPWLSNLHSSSESWSTRYRGPMTSSVAGVKDVG